MFQRNHFKMRVGSNDLGAGTGGLKNLSLLEGSTAGKVGSWGNTPFLLRQGVNSANNQ